MKVPEQVLKAVETVLDYHLSDRTQSAGCALRCGYDGDDMSAHLAGHVMDAAAPLMLATQHATEAQLRESNAARQERIWALESTIRTLRNVSATKSPIQLWEMYAREHQERMRLLERNRKLEAKILRRARIVGALRSANRKMLVQIVGAGYRVPE